MLKKDNDSYGLFINSAIYDLIIGIFMVFIMYFAYPKYIVPLLVGLFIACLNFGLNTTMTNFALSPVRSARVGVILISFTSRIIFTAGIGIIYYQKNAYYLFPFCFGFFLHFISLIFSSIHKGIYKRK